MLKIPTKWHKNLFFVNSTPRLMTSKYYLYYRKCFNREILTLRKMFFLLDFSIFIQAKFKFTLKLKNRNKNG